MSFGRRNTPPRHLVGAEREPWVPKDADFDVAAAFEPDFDFEALFAADDAPAEPVETARASRKRVAVALSVTLAALPLLFLDNFQATASQSNVDASQQHDTSSTTPTVLPQRLPTTEDAPTTLAPLPQAVVFQADPTTTTEAPTTTTEAPTTTATPTTVKVASKPVVIVTTTTTEAPTTTTTAAPAPPKVAATSVGDPSAEATWDALAKCESGGNWAANTGNGYYGGLQFSLSTWRDLGGEGYPNKASKATQIAIGKKQYARSGWSAWPSCARKLGWE